MQLSPLEIIRRESLQKLRELGINPYPAEEFKTTATIKQITSNFDAFEGKINKIIADKMAIMVSSIAGRNLFIKKDLHIHASAVKINTDKITFSS